MLLILIRMTTVVDGRRKIEQANSSRIVDYFTI